MAITFEVSIKEYEDMVIAGKSEINFNKTKSVHVPLAEKSAEEDRGMEL